MNIHDDDRYLWDRTGPPDEEIRALEELLRPLRHDETSAVRLVAGPRRLTQRRRLLLGAAAVAALALVGLGLGLAGRSDTRDAQPVPPHPALRADGTDVAESGWVTADADDVDLRLGEGLGYLTLERGGRLQVRRLAGDVTRLYLERGTLDALVSADARPRFFQVDTPATRCVDLGCQYTLEVDEDGTAFVHVRTGRVAFENDGREVYVPAGAVCTARREGGAGTPRYLDAPAPLVEALDAYDGAPQGSAARRDAAAAAAAAAGRLQDTLSVWHLLQDDDERIRRQAQQHLERLASVVDVDDPQTLEDWKRRLEPFWG